MSSNLQRLLDEAPAVRRLDDPELVPMMEPEDWERWSNLVLQALSQNPGSDSHLFANFKRQYEQNSPDCTEEAFMSMVGILKAAATYEADPPPRDVTKARDDSFEALLHPVIKTSSLKQLYDGHYRDAVLNGAIGLFDFIRERSGSSTDGEPLVGEVLSTGKPKLILSDLDSESGKNDQVGFMSILQGTYRGIRNPKAHTLVTDLTDLKARQYLVFLSLLARRIEEARKV